MFKHLVIILPEATVCRILIYHSVDEQQFGLKRFIFMAKVT